MTSFVDLFSGAGGLTLGLIQAGWRHLCSVDNSSVAIKTHKKNFPGLCTITSDLTALTSQEILDHCSERPDWIVGGPPCQGFSTVGKRDINDPRNALVQAYARIVKDIRPNNFLLENVIGMRDLKVLEQVSRLFNELGYKVSPVILRSADYGVPQLRHRIFFIGNIYGRGFVKPAPLFSEDQFVTVWDAIGDLPTLRPGQKKDLHEHFPFTNYQFDLRGNENRCPNHEASKHPDYLVHAISHIPDGGNRRSIPNAFQPKSGYHNSYARLFSSAPAVAVTQNMGKPSGTRCIHPIQNRGLTAREGARLQGFPDSFVFVGGIIDQRHQIANAVPPKLASVIGRALLSSDSWVDSPDRAETYNRTFDELESVPTDHDVEIVSDPVVAAE